MATKNQMRPSCAKVKVEVDLTAKLPKRVRITEEDDDTGHTKFKWVQVQYDHMPKYCQECCLQGHDENTCWSLHPELYEARSIEDKKETCEEKDTTACIMGGKNRVLTSGKIVGYKQNKQEWMIRRINKHKRNKYGHIEGKNDVQDENPFAVLQGEGEQQTESKIIKEKEETTKDWVNKTFSEKENIARSKERHEENTSEGNASKEMDIRNVEFEQHEQQQGDIPERGEKKQIVNEEKIQKEGHQENEKVVVLYENSTDEVLPLAIHNEGQEDNLVIVNGDKEDLRNNIESIALEGDLSPKQKGKLNESLIKLKKQGGVDHAAQASSRSKRTIIKNTRYQFYFIGRMEPFEEKKEIEEYKRKLGMKYALANGNGKIWAFIDEAMDYTIIRDEEQMLTLKLQSQGMDLKMVVSLVYAKCMQSERLQLWDLMETIASSTNLPWLVGGDFNVISNAEEKLGGRSIPESDVEDFNHCTNVYNLEDQGFKGSKYMWWNGRMDANCIFKRLDRILGNGIQNIFPILEVEHLVRSGSDHTPLLITFNTSNENVVRPFKFLNF
ncbi:hypothetical protein H5410_003376 [Solanum commersonii]|uniref:Endonuclease/exonuclease/phosphatase domain-containing protein n=1 Tax=Solanum commersonii TaxID=4109 RepID=A0A9J6B4W2_SOLCO|nr:hypothetical protein H5410_003376 [Solanum commersonii]